LAEFYDPIIEFIGTKCVKICDITFSCLNGTSHDFLVDCVWASIAASIIENVPYMFSSGNPLTFHQSYQATSALVLKIEHHCNDLQVFRESQSYLEFNKKWQLGVYFQLWYSNTLI
jgi:hypothetical protein